MKLLLKLPNLLRSDGLEKVFFWDNSWVCYETFSGLLKGIKNHVLQSPAFLIHDAQATRENDALEKYYCDCAHFDWQIICINKKQYNLRNDYKRATK